MKKDANNFNNADNSNAFSHIDRLSSLPKSYQTRQLPDEELADITGGSETPTAATPTLIQKVGSIGDPTITYYFDNGCTITFTRIEIYSESIFNYSYGKLNEAEYNRVMLFKDNPGAEDYALSNAYNLSAQ
ncbi:MAG: hypothetical protein LBJ95_03125 [Oscillospiraceae bacterium]|jgi:hypothetical protein|nr:hypothetical protein [Oscillospiraceae bacterium]